MNIGENLVIDRISRFGITEKCCLPEKDLSKMSLCELRNYVTFFCELPYCHSGKGCNISGLLTTEKEVEIQSQLNLEFNRRVGNDFVCLYEFLFKKLNKDEQWSGDERYKIYTYDKPPYDVFIPFIKTKKLLSKYGDSNKIITMIQDFKESEYKHYKTLSDSEY